MIEFEDLLSRRPVAPSNSEVYRIEFDCPQGGHWKKSHCIYGLVPLGNEDDVVFIALPNDEDIWNFMTYHSNTGTPMRIPVSISKLRMKEVEIIWAKRPVYVHKSLISWLSIF